MKNRKQRSPGKAAAQEDSRTSGPLAGTGLRAGIPWRNYAAGLFVCLFVAFEIYQPVLHAPFLYDDLYLPFTDASYANQPLSAWIGIIRPLLGFTYWLNYQGSGLDPGPYHAWNILLHAGASIFVWLITRKLLASAGETGWKREVLATFASAVFLTHPLQTESVAYVASRSETLSVMFAYAAVCAYLYRSSEAIGYSSALAVLALFGAAAASKEHAVVLPGVFILADLYWSGKPKVKAILGNWRLYLPVVAAGAVGASFVWRILRESATAGFGMKDLTWSQYFFTQCRAIWVYLRLFFLPYGQNIDHDFPISRSIPDYGAIFGLAGLLAIAGAAWHYRVRFRLASFGIAIFLFLLAPTSSFVPIRDVLVERRMYLPMIGLLLAIVELLRRVPLGKFQLVGLCAGIAVVLGVVTYHRNEVWSNPISLWQDAADKSPARSRPRFQLAFALYSAGQCEKAAQEFEKAAALSVPDTGLLVDWALAYDCSGQPDKAVQKLELALHRGFTAHIYSLIGMVRAKQGLSSEAWDALNAALELNPRYDVAYFYRGNLHMAAGNYAAAEAEYRRALELNPASDLAKQGLVNAQSMIRPGAEKTP